MRKYWVIAHKWSNKTTDKDVEEELIPKCLKHKYVCMQYEYGIQKDKGTITRRWNKFKEIQEGDIIFLRGVNKIYSWGHAIKPRFDNNLEKHTTECQHIIDKNSHGKYRSDKYDGYIEFTDCDVFYENLEDGKEGWGQRINIDEWHDVRHDYYEKGGTSKDGSNYDIAKNIGKDKAEEIISKLSRKLFKFPEEKEVKMQAYIQLLEQQKNIVLTGAPGTGKTYLAKDIAKEMTSNKDENIKFVQFHPSFDYTDFVEGLRPKYSINDEGKQELGFELKDGIFKEFCKMAQPHENLKDNEGKLLCKFVFIIDEINRAEISKVFGELFFSIDPGYRDSMRIYTMRVVQTLSKMVFMYPKMYIL